MARNSRILIVLLVCSLLGMAACRAPDAARRPNVLLIVVDTLRWDHVGCYGHDRDTTPAVDRLAAEATRFERAYSTAPWTIPAVASMLTGLYPSHHTAVSFDRELPEQIDTLAEILHAEGYVTAGVISHSAIDSSHNFDQGFDVFLESEARGHDHVSTPGVTAQAVEQLAALSSSGAPFFLFVHYFDPHYNYVRHPEFGFAGPSAGRLTGTEPMADLRRMEHDLTPDEVLFLRDLYDEEIRFTDAGVGRLLDRLEELGRLEDTLVVFTSDHGEEFLDHAHLGHTRTLYEELVRVPLIVRDPSRSLPVGVVQRPVSVVSLTPTVLDLVGIDPTRLGFQAGSLRTEPSDEVFCEVDFVPVRKSRMVPEVHKRSLIESRHKLIRDEGSGLVELYDLEDDPAERSDLHEQQPDPARRLSRSLARMAEHAASGGVDPSLRAIDDAEIERLKALGYVGDR